ncbi:hypothetical protein CASFOL_004316 [Castilleja foliolosa]|uniref:Longin domain-containing protein n=1 Tax=Castilleja foliolosa TaxID=1961234 RepID=A0ABD3EAW2_9LAMI
MVSDPGLIHYACIAKGATVLAESNSKDASLGAIAAKCLHNTPPFHSRFTHTVRSRTYAFLIDDNFVYFVIFDDKLEKSEGFAFLESVKIAFAGVTKNHKKPGLQNLTSHCYQGELNPVFRQLLRSDMEGLGSPTGQRLSHSGGFQSGPGPIRERSKPSSLNKMKNRLFDWEKKENDEDMGNGLIVHNKNGGLIYSGEISGHQKAKKVWKKQVWFILSLDFVICVIMFGVWLWVCSGFKCIDS